MPYKRINDLTGLYFHDSSLIRANRARNTITLTFSSAVVIGHSCPELKNWKPCPLNRGEDRYARPELILRLEGVKELNILKGGCWRDGAWVYPPRNLQPREQVLEQPMPIWENGGYWYTPLHLQHPLADVELVPWDSSYLLLLSHDEKLVRQFRAAFPKSEDLVEYIKSQEEGRK